MGKNLEYFKVNIFLLYRRIIEYKMNFWIDFFAQTSFLILGYLFLYLWQINFGEIIDWSYIDYLLLFTLADTLWCLGGFFFWQGDLFKLIVSGELSSILMKPINPFLGVSLRYLELSGLIMFVLNMPILIILFILIDVKIKSLFLFILFSIIITILYICFYYLIHSLEFHFKKSSSLIRQASFGVHNTLTTYPFQFFNKFSLKYFLLFYPTLYISSILIPILNGKEIWNLKLQLVVIFLIVIISIIGTFINWKYGLKKYEAFG